MSEGEEHGESVPSLEARLYLVESRIRTIAKILDPLIDRVGTLVDASINIFQGYNEAERGLLLEMAQNNAAELGDLIGRISELLAALEE